MNVTFSNLMKVLRVVFFFFALPLNMFMNKWKTLSSFSPQWGVHCDSGHFGIIVIVCQEYGIVAQDAVVYTLWTELLFYIADTFHTQNSDTNSVNFI